MDHIFFSFPDYFWGKTFVGLPLFLGILLGGPESMGFVKLLIRNMLERNGWVQAVPPRDQRYLVADMLLGTQLAVYYVGKVERDRGVVSGP